MTAKAPANRKKTLVISGLILLLGVGMTTLIFMTEPAATRSGAVKQTAMLVEVIRPKGGSFHPVIAVTGSVRAAQDIVLSPRVGGKVVALAPEFVPGGFVKQGDTLLTIDPADYRNVLQQRRGVLSQAVAELAVEMGRQNVAQQEYDQLFEGTLSAENRALVLRKPQLNAARMRVQSARAALNQAELDLQRATVEAPFNAQIIDRSVNLGSQVSAGTPLARLIGLDTYWVVAAVPLSKNRWLSFPDESGKKRGSEVELRNSAAWARGASRQGYLYKLLGALDEQTRMARVLIEVPDPLARGRGSSDTNPPLMVGEFVEVRIRGNPVHDVVRLDRDYLRKEDTVWLVQDGRLRVQEVEVTVRDPQYAYIAKGLSEHDQVVKTNLATVVEGARLRVQSEEPTR